MHDLKLNIEDLPNSWATDELAEKIYRSYQAGNIKCHTQDFRQFRTECSRQLQTLSMDQVKEISKILLLKYDLRVLGYELIYYHDF